MTCAARCASCAASELECGVIAPCHPVVCHVRMRARKRVQGDCPSRAMRPVDGVRGVCWSPSSPVSSDGRAVCCGALLLPTSTRCHTRACARRCVKVGHPWWAMHPLDGLHGGCWSLRSPVSSGSTLSAWRPWRKGHFDRVPLVQEVDSGCVTCRSCMGLMASDESASLLRARLDLVWLGQGLGGPAARLGATPKPGSRRPQSRWIARKIEKTAAASTRRGEFS